jgi:hypothetical protein
MCTVFHGGKHDGTHEERQRHGLKMSYKLPHYILKGIKTLEDRRGAESSSQNFYG